MTRRAVRVALLAGLLATFVVGCGSSGKDSQADVKGVRLGAVIKGLDNPFFVTMREGLVATARRNDARLQVAAAPVGIQDTTGQASEVASVAAAKPACYVINPITPTNLVRALADLPGKAPIINVDSAIGKQAASAVGVKIASYVGTDNRAGGRLAADTIARLVDPGARIAVITGISGDVPSADRAAGFEQGTRGRFKVVASIAADYVREKARRATADLLRTDPHIAGVFAVNDLMALGVADAVRAAGKSRDVQVVGFDGIREALAAVRRGRLAATVSQYPYVIGQLGVEACLAAIAGRDVPATVDAPVQVITKQNVERAQASFPRPVEPFSDPFAR
jgi:ABC-type sugar transport system substrate-binding protein